jgi:hypothetical protein
VIPWDGGAFLPGIDPDKVGQYAEQLEDEERMRKSGYDRS